MSNTANASKTPPSCRKTLLLVDDNPINLTILSKILQGSYDLLTATDGKMAMEQLRNPKNPPISAVVLDIVMPKMDGYAVLRTMRADPKLAQIPVLVTSGQDSEGGDDKEVLALSLGANDYVTKPYKPEIIRHRISNAIYLWETAAFVNTVQRDALTGLYSKAYFELQVEQTLKDNPGIKYDMICCDIERFKLVNDLYGTAVGDKLLQHCARIFQEILGENNLLSRIGSDVFACLVRHQGSYSNQTFSRIVEKINQTDIHLSIELRYGIYTIDDTTLPVSGMCDRARLALAAIKGLYGTYFKQYDDAIRQRRLEEQYITEHMKDALRDGQFEVYFQPKYDLKSEQVVGAEALVRWNNPERGQIPPGQFIPLFEKNGFITDLDIFVWDTVCKKIRAWLDRGHVTIPVSVNVSRADVYNPHIDDILLSLIRKYRLSPKYISLEITESAYTQNSQQLINMVQKLKKIGFCIEMDDFGTGYSSLNMLSELPIDVIKLDIGFLQHQKQYNNRSILSFIISLAKWMGLGVLAEGVENAQQANLLRSLHCECAQGFYYSKPLPAAAFEALLLHQFEAHPVTATQLEIKLGQKPEEPAPLFHPAAVLVLDPAAEDSHALRRIFSDRFFVIPTTTVDETVMDIERQKSDIIAVFCVCDRPDFIDDLTRIVAHCRTYNLPVLTIHTDGSQIKAALNAGVSDFIAKPYLDEVVKLRAANAVAREQMSQFEREKEINDAILEMKQRAERDALTGLLNRAEFENRVTDLFRNDAAPDGVFVMMDVDNFKSINDSCGHADGDQVLQYVANTMRGLFPETDLLVRMGGDEFAAMIPFPMEQNDLEKKISTLCTLSGLSLATLTVTCSVGLCRSPKDGRDFQTLYENADMALLAAKRCGKGIFRMYQKEMETPVDKQLEKLATSLLDDATDAMFVCDAVTNKIIYINDTACHLLQRSKKNCLGSFCYELFWQRCDRCDRCKSITSCRDHFYQEDTVMCDGHTRLHLKARADVWNGRKVNIHYLTMI